MTDEECRLDVASVRVLPFAVEHFFVQFDVVVVDGVIEGNGYHLGNVLCREVSGDLKYNNLDMNCQLELNVFISINTRVYSRWFRPRNRSSLAKRRRRGRMVAPCWGRYRYL